MSTYELMSGGPYPLAGLFLNLAGIDVRSIPRLRDAHLELEDGVPILRVLCRAGGNNRSLYPDLLELLQARPNYLRDDDCSRDTTYLEMRFQFREDFHEALAEVYTLLSMPPPYDEAFPHYIARVAEGASIPWAKDPAEVDFQRVEEALNTILGRLEAS